MAGPPDIDPTISGRFLVCGALSVVEEQYVVVQFSKRLHKLSEALRASQAACPAQKYGIWLHSGEAVVAGDVLHRCVHIVAFQRTCKEADLALVGRHRLFRTGPQPGA